MEGTNPVKDMLNVDDLLSKWKPRTKLEEVWWWIRYGIWNWIGWRGDLYRYIKRFFQRGCRGYGDCDVWDFHSYLSEVISGGVKDLIEDTSGHPCNLKNLDEWKDILTEILWTFDTASKISSGNLLYLPPHERSEKEMKKLQKFADDCEIGLNKYEITKGTKYTVMTYSECEKYEKGWFLFQKYFFNLWD